MGRSAGAGSPISFRCIKCRSSLRRGRDHRGGYRVQLTGRTKPYARDLTDCRGTRSTDTSREYRCLTCNHVGFSNHSDLERLERRGQAAKETSQ